MPKAIRFIVPGRPSGYTTTNNTGRRSKQIIKYWDYCKVVRASAEAAGIKLPMVATEARCITIYTRCFFENRVHADPENVHKGIKDALFYVSKEMKLKLGIKGTADKYTGGCYTPPIYGHESAPCVEVVIVTPFPWIGVHKRIYRYLDGSI